MGSNEDAFTVPRDPESTTRTSSTHSTAIIASTDPRFREDGGRRPPSQAARHGSQALYVQSPSRKRPQIGVGRDRREPVYRCVGLVAAEPITPIMDDLSWMLQICGRDHRAHDDCLSPRGLGPRVDHPAPRAASRDVCVLAIVQHGVGRGRGARGQHGPAPNDSVPVKIERTAVTQLWYDAASHFCLLLALRLVLCQVSTRTA